MHRLLLAGLCLLLSSCVVVLAHGSHRRTGSGQRQQAARQVPAFDAIEFRGSGHLHVQVGAAQSLRLSCDDDFLREVTTEVHGSTLVIDYPDELRFREELSVEIVVPELCAVQGSGSVEVYLEGVQGSRLQLGVSGSGNMQASGKVEHLAASISGSGALRLAALSTDSADVRISGSGSMELDVSTSLSYAISGSGAILYSGEAKSHGTLSGSGSVQRKP